MAATIRVLIADDKPAARAGIAAALARQSDIQIIGEAANGNDAAKMYFALKPDVVLIDSSLPGLTAWEAIAHIRERDPNARIVALSTSVGDADAHRAMAAGARGLLLKGAAADDLLSAIRTLHQGRRWLPPEAAKILASRAAWVPLSEREMDILRKMALEQSNREIAGAFGITESTAKAYVNSILAKLGVDDSKAAVAAGLKRGILHLQ